jgi:hypothetical protein
VTLGNLHIFERCIHYLSASLESIRSGCHVGCYEAKKMHYIPAIERVVSIIQKGVNDRLTVNGEIGDPW